MEKTMENSFESLSTGKKLPVFERYLSVWVALCMVAGVALGKGFPDSVQFLRSLEFGHGRLRIPFHMDAAPIRLDGKWSRREPRGLTRRVNGLGRRYSLHGRHHTADLSFWANPNCRI